MAAGRQSLCKGEGEGEGLVTPFVWRIPTPHLSPLHLCKGRVEKGCTGAWRKLAAGCAVLIAAESARPALARYEADEMLGKFAKII
jgi:hypothetical protein